MNSRRVALVVAFVLIVLGSTVGRAAERSAAKLKTVDVQGLTKRFATFNDALPDAAKLGMSKLTAFEEHPHFVYAAGVLASNNAKVRGKRRVIFVRPDTLIIDDQFPTGITARWTLEHQHAIGPDNGIQDDSRINPRLLWCARPARARILLRLRGIQIFEFSGNTRYVVALNLKSGKIAECTATERNGTVQVKVTSGDRVCDLALPTGADAPMIAVTEDKKPVLAQRPLPAGIMPHGAKGVRMIEGWDKRYRSNSKAPWDSGKPDSKLVAAVEAGTLKPGRAVVLGCGSGTNAIYLAKKGFDVTAMDVAPTALAIAKTKADKANVTVRWMVADVLAPPTLKPFDVIFDRGCYHGVRRVSATGYVKTTDALSKPGTMMLILAGNANEARHYGPPRVDETHLVSDFAKTWDFVHLQEHRDGAWFWSALMRRRAK